MRASAFFKKWDDAFMAALQPIVEEIREAGFSVDGPYSMFDENTPIWGFTAWKAPVRPDDNEAVDVWWKLEPVYDEKPLRFWPAIDMIEKGGAGVGSTEFWDELVDLGDEPAIRMILEGLDTETGWVIKHLEEQEWTREGPKEWIPGRGKRRRR